jgi:hypothetical protein
LPLEARRGGRVSAETIRRGRHRLGGHWKRAQIVASDQDPERAGKRAQIRMIWESLRPRQVLLFAHELAIHWLPKSGYPWMPKGQPGEGMTPGKKEKHYRAGAWDSRTGLVHSCFGSRQTNPRFRDLLDILECRYPASRYDRI